ncbi:hypothetical protein JK359_09085 [Streptomyces actinomycinicus]|uniref:DUF1795 domain-containing protein n=1 Tax=Streptomyces actinomycinicus TaxID=1695166 RepID=A0A937JL76_9ACTN|nr:hypothetical protein [Streptomyces actinomycinicus]MBL1082135.1 hypothetical protein [Streptomyces actinomycinicus]
MTRLQRLALLAASTTVITGGALLPTAAFAAPPAPPAAAAAAASAIDPNGADTGGADAGGDDGGADSNGIDPGGADTSTSNSSNTSNTDTSGTDSVGSTAQWTTATDEESGISMDLPGQAETQVDQLDGRDHWVETDYGSIGFAVYDGDDLDPEEMLQQHLQLLNENAQSADQQFSTSNVNQTRTNDGAQLEADLTADDGTYGHVLYATVDGHLLMIALFGTEDQTDAMQADFDQLMESIQVPGGSTTGSGDTQSGDSQAGDSQSADGQSGDSQSADAAPAYGEQAT